MQQVSQYIRGERDYVKLYGDTGPLVYPAAHVYIYRFLYSITDEGRDIKLAQYIFIGLYLATLLLVIQCYRVAKVPPYVLPMLILSKRLHSIFLLRLFNDCFAVFFLFLAIYCYQRRYWTVGSLAYSLGLGVKMSLLLALPAVAVMLWQGMGRNRALAQAMLMGQVQVCRTINDQKSILTYVRADYAWLPVPRCELSKLPFESFRIQSPVPVQVDGELAFRWRGEIFVSGVLVGVACSTYLGSRAFPCHEMASCTGWRCCSTADHSSIEG